MREARLTPTSSVDCRIAEPKRSKKWLLTLPLMPTRPSGSAAGEPSAIVTPSGRTRRVHITVARFWPGCEVGTIFADQPAAALDQHLAAVEAAHVALHQRAGQAGPGRIERGLQHGGIRVPCGTVVGRCRITERPGARSDRRATTIARRQPALAAPSPAAGRPHGVAGRRIDDQRRIAGPARAPAVAPRPAVAACGCGT